LINNGGKIGGFRSDKRKERRTKIIHVQNKKDTKVRERGVKKRGGKT